MKYTKEFLEPIVQTSFSIFQVLEKLGLSKAGGNHSHIKKVIANLSLDTSHFTGQAHLRGKTHTWGAKLSPTVIFTVGSKVARKNVKNRILKDGLIPYKCAHCFNTGEHNNKPLVLELDHINGVYNDNRLENLRFLCPNCHSQTSTSSGKNNKNKAPW